MDIFGTALEPSEISLEPSIWTHGYPKASGSRNLAMGILAGLDALKSGFI